MFNMFKCYGDVMKGFGIDSIDTADDLSKVMKLKDFDVKNIDHDNYCK